MDKTILNEKDEISQKDIEAIEYILNKGIKFVFASGRNITSMYRHIDTVLKDKKEYAISQNGACVFDLENDKTLFKSTIKKSISMGIVEYGIKHNLTMELFTPKKVYLYNGDKSQFEDYKRRQIDFEKVENNEILSLIKEDICKINYIDNSRELLTLHKDRLQVEYGEKINFAFSNTRYLDMTCKDVNKAEGIKVISDILNIRNDEIIAIGDNYNDLEMINRFYGVCVSNAVLDLKKEAKLVLNSSYKDSPIVEIVERLSL